MMRDESDGIFKLVVGLAVLLAVVILYYAGRRAFTHLAIPGQAAPVSAQPAQKGGSLTETPPSYLPPIKLIRIEGKRAKRETPPAVPKPPVKAEDKK